MGKNAGGLKKALENLSGKTLRGDTTGEIYEALNAHYADVALKVAVKDELGEAVATPTVVIKLGSTTINAETDGSYKTKMGTYTYSVTKTGYEEATGEIEIGYDDADAAVKNVTIVLSSSL
jgi:hypothetical protein